MGVTATPTIVPMNFGFMSAKMPNDTLTDDEERAKGV
jgi:hypothetical protein